MLLLRVYARSERQQQQRLLWAETVSLRCKCFLIEYHAACRVYLCVCVVFIISTHLPRGVAHGSSYAYGIIARQSIGTPIIWLWWFCVSAAASAIAAI